MLVCLQEEELASNNSDHFSADDEGSEEYDESDAKPDDKENISPNPALTSDSTGGSADKPQAEVPHGRRGRKRKRQTADGLHSVAQANAATRRQRIRQYYNGATHSSASAVQLFAMAMQVGLMIAK